MTQVLVPYFQHPEYGVDINSANPLAGLEDILMNAAGHKAAFLFHAPKAGTITKVGFLTGAVTTAVDTDLRVETVDMATGDPSGTLWAANTNVTILAASIVASSWIEATLTAGAVVAKGDLVAIVIAPTGTPNYNVKKWGRVSDEFPYCDRFTAAWAKDSDGPIIGIEYNDGSYALTLACWPFSAVSNTSFNSGSTPDERGIKFRVPVPTRMVGFWIYAQIVQDTQIKLYDAADTVLATVTLDANLRVGPNAGTMRILYATPVQLTANAWYRLTVVPTLATPNIILGEFAVAAAAKMDMMPGGQDVLHTSRTDAGAWTDVATQRAFLAALLDAFDDGAGGGGGKAGWISG